jgi:predicted RNA-binding Zn ribbon-like protein
MWESCIGIGDHVSEKYLNLQLDEVRLRVFAGEDGGHASGWDCPSLLTAVHLMYFLDLLANVELKQCQAPGCQEYFRVGPQSRLKLYCPPPLGKKASRCASRVSSARHRERQRKRADGA